MHSAIAAPSVHGERRPSESQKSFRAQVLASLHRSHDGREGLELLLFRAQKAVRLEERDDLGQEVGSSSNHVYQCRVGRTGVIPPDATAAEPSRDQVEDLSALRILADVKLRDELPAGSRRWVPLYGDVERSLPVDESRDVSIQPFLLIGRTCRIVTAHVGKLTAASDVASSAGYPAFPAFGRI